MKNKKIFFVLILGILLFSSFAFAQTEVPKNIQQATEQNKIRAQNTLATVSFIIAFFAGILTMLSPCVLPLLPAFFAYAFKEKEQVTKMTSIFFIGFTIMFIIMGLLAVTIGGGSLALFQQDINVLIWVAGFFLIIFGLMSFFGRGFSGLKFKKKFKHDSVGTFGYGLVFAIGWTACMGPILAGILLMASVMNNYFTASYLMLFYSLGIFMPLFILSFGYDKYGLSKSKIIKGKTINLKIGKSKLKLHSTNMISGLILIGIGILFIVYQGTAIINTFGMFGLRNYFYTVQNIVLQNPVMYNILGGMILVLFSIGLWKILKKQIKMWRKI